MPSRFVLSLLTRVRHFACLLFATVLIVVSMTGGARAQTAQPVLAQFLSKISPDDLVPGADAFGPIRDDVAVAPLMKEGAQIGHVFITSDFVGTTGYSGKPIHTMVAVDDDARILGIDLVKHSEPIVLIGIPRHQDQGDDGGLHRSQPCRGSRGRGVGSRSQHYLRRDRDDHGD